MARMTDTRERFIDSGTRLFRRRGYSATGVKQLVAEGGAPIGSLYHFFPGGKEEIAVASVRKSAVAYDALFDKVFARHEDIGDVVTAWFRAAAKFLKDSDFRDGCPVGTLVGETAPESEAIRAEGRAVFAWWRRRLSDRLEELGVEPREARRLAVYAVAAIEGAIMMSRVDRATAPVTDTGAVVARTLSQAVSAAGGHHPSA